MIELREGASDLKGRGRAKGDSAVKIRVAIFVPELKDPLEQEGTWPERPCAETLQDRNQSIWRPRPTIESRETERAAKKERRRNPR